MMLPEAPRGGVQTRAGCMSVQEALNENVLGSEMPNSPRKNPCWHYSADGGWGQLRDVTPTHRRPGRRAECPRTVDALRDDLGPWGHCLVGLRAEVWR